MRFIIFTSGAAAQSDQSAPRLTARQRDRLQYRWPGYGGRGDCRAGPLVTQERWLKLINASAESAVKMIGSSW